MKIGSNSAFNGIEGLKQVQKRHEQNEFMYQLILLDYSMPVMNGLETAEAIREAVQQFKS